MNGEPLVSVIIPVFNQGEYLHEAIDSVFAQEYSNFEIIVINDGSTDEYTIDILKNLKSIYKLRVINTANLGVVHARNIGIKECRGELILPLDSDDKIGKNYITQAVEILTEDKDVGIVYAQAKYFGVVHGQMYLKKFSLKAILEKNIIYSSAFFRKKDWNNIGGYKNYMDEGLEDWDLWLSIIELGRKVVLIPEVLFFYRIKKNSRNKRVHSDPRLLFSIKLEIIKHHRELYMREFDVLEGIIEDLNRHIFQREDTLDEIRKSVTFRLSEKMSRVYNKILLRKPKEK